MLMVLISVVAVLALVPQEAGFDPGVPLVTSGETQVQGQNIETEEPPSPESLVSETTATLPLEPVLSSPLSTRVREIDEVWAKKIGLFVRNSAEIWNLNKWVSFESVYAPLPIVPPITVAGVPGTVTLSFAKQINGVSEKSNQEQCFTAGYGVGNSVQTEKVTVGGKAFAVNKAMAQPLRNVARVIEQMGYKINAVGSCRTNGNQPANCGNFHLACLAVDINPSHNPHCPKVANWATWWGYTPTPEERERCRRAEVITDIPPEIVNAFEENGFYWGGRYGQQYGKPTPDTMHFEYVDGSAKCCSRTYAPLTYNYLTPAPLLVSTIPGVAREDQYDQIIAEAASKFKVDAPLIKAIIKQESTFNPMAANGGLMQVNDFSTHYNSMIRSYPELTSISNNPADPRTNILLGTYLFDKTRKALKGCTELKCQIAAYNIGAGLVNKAALGVGDTSTWTSVYTQLRPELFRQFDVYKSWSDDKILNRIQLVGRYVDMVISNTQSYTGQV
ncbi:TPA: transglycosylase SLT domain-containing protein [Candidatus Woesearchaeota archaeon]|nr:transglycosylase SLT domain-containing protein [Candidatus Woesearchaeota archaeon]HIG93776.1 transglycosylase SLT domain-containing protein [Candidatus Woesearchaeota archaeon]HIH13046.1 transglycosylase SLT domain-containing protein [Candidatus Woesearchaeota archaeon]